jgi:hypothetical protein
MAASNGMVVFCFFGRDHGIQSSTEFVMLSKPMVQKGVLND